MIDYFRLCSVNVNGCPAGLGNRPTGARNRRKETENTTKPNSSFSIHDPKNVMLLPGFEAVGAVVAGPGLLHWVPGTGWASGHLFRAAHPSVARVVARAFRELKYFFLRFYIKKIKGYSQYQNGEKKVIGIILKYTSE